MKNKTNNEDMSAYLSEIGRRGGKKTAKRGPEYYREIQKIGVKRRLERKKKSDI